MSQSDSFKLYEDGKHRRYSLLFAVNGGAFAVACYITEHKEDLLGLNLSLHDISIGMIVLTVAMAADIAFFGEKMREHVKDVFQWPGKLVLAIISCVIALGWYRIQ